MQLKLRTSKISRPGGLLSSASRKDEHPATGGKIINSYLNITVRVQSQQALAELNKLDSATKGIGSSGSTAAGGLSQLDRAFNMTSIEKFGKNLQWTGRQLEYNFTLPILLAGGAIGKFALDNERAMTRVRMVYGGAGDDAGMLSSELDALGKSFELLSSYMGVNQAKVIDIASEWAEAGVAGRALADATRLTLEVMKVGNIDQEKAITGLMAIQSAYGLNATQLREQIALLAGVNKTGTITFAGLIDVVQRAGSVARAAGIDIQHLAAMANVLTPAAGSAAQAGNSLRTMISRLTAPTKDTVNVLAQMGVNVMDASWQAANGVKRFDILAQAFDKLSTAQKNQASSLIASRWQVNRFDILMEQMADHTSAFYRAINETADPVKNMSVYVGMLTTQLSSTPQGISMLMNTMRNALTSAIIPMIPALVAVIARVTELALWFSHLDPRLQQLAVGFLIALAAVGPLAKYIGALSTLYGALGSAVGLVGKALGFKAAATAVDAAATAADAVANADNAEAIEAEAVSASRLGIVFGKVGSLIKTGFVAAGDFIVGAAGLFAGAITNVAFGAGQVLVKLFANIPLFLDLVVQQAEAIATAMVEGISAIWSTLPILMGIIGQGVVLVWETIYAGIIGMWEAFPAFMESVATFARTIPMFVALAWTVAQEAVVIGWGAVNAAIFTLWEALVPAAIAAGEAIQLAFSFESILAGFTSMIEYIGVAIAALPEFIGMVAAGIAAAFSSPWVALAAIVVGFVVMFRQEILDGLRTVVDDFNHFPPAIVNAMRAVVSIVQQTAMAVYHWLSYINPFARHSPSIVDQVIAGVDLISKKYASLSNIGQSFRNAVGDMKAFKDATDDINKAATARERAAIVNDAGPSAGAAFDQLFASQDALQAALDATGKEYINQGNIVAAWKAKLDDANQSVDAEKQKLDDLQRVADVASKKLSDAKDVLDKLSRTNPAGLKAMEDAIFANGEAQKAIQLQMLQIEDQAGGSLDKLQAKLASLRGEIENLQGERTSLRMAGAGSDILAPYDAQITALQNQQQAITNLTEPLAGLQTQLDQLQRSGSILDLQKSLNFDGPLRQIQDIVNNVQEMPLDQLIPKLTNQKQIVDQLQTAYDAINVQVDNQKNKVDDVTRARDALQKTYDDEKKKLDDIGQVYDDIAKQIQEMDTAVQAVVSSMSKLKQSGGPTLNQDLFNAGKDHFFDIPGGTTTLGREGGLDDIKKFNEDMQKQLDDMLKGMGHIDMLGPIKDMWSTAWKWLQDNVGPYVNPVFTKVRSFWDRGWAALTSGGNGPLQNVFDNLKSTADGMSWDTIFSPIVTAWDSIGEKLKGTALGSTFDNITAVFRNIGDMASTGLGVVEKYVVPFAVRMGGYFTKLMDTVRTQFSKWGDLLAPTQEALGHIAAFVSGTIDGIVDIIKVSLGIILFIWAVAWPVLSNVLTPILNGIIELVSAALKTIHGVIMFVLGIINGDWGQVWEGIKLFLSGIWDSMFAVARFSLGLIYGVIKGVLDDITTLFSFLWDHSLGPVFSGIWSKMKSMWDGIGGLIRDGINIGIKAINILISALDKVADVLPGIDFHINPIPELGSGSGGPSDPQFGGNGTKFMASGGVVPFITNGPRAIVGEGNPLYPEFVIPTDPTHRQRALDLFGALGGRLMGSGGILGGITDRIGGAIGAGAGLVGDIAGDVTGVFRKGAAIAIFKPLMTAANLVIDRIPWKFAKEAVKGFENLLYDWVAGNDTKSDGKKMASGGIVISPTRATVGEAGPEAVLPLSVLWQHLDTGNIEIINSINRMDSDLIMRLVDIDTTASNTTSAVMGLATAIGPMTAVAPPIVDAINQLGSKLEGSFQSLDSSISSISRVGNTPTSPTMPTTPTTGSTGGTGATQQFYDFYNSQSQAVQQYLWSVGHPGGDPYPGYVGSVHMAAAGGIFNARPGGYLVNLAEGGRDEAVVPLPANGLGGDRVVNIYGNLEFPNIRSGEDAETLISNLESLT